VVAENGTSREYKLVIARQTTLVNGITLDPNSITLSSQGATRTISATIQPSEATNQILTWTSGNTSVATVSNTGVVTAVAAGSTTITARATDSSNTSGTATVHVQSWDASINNLRVNTVLALGTPPNYTANIGTGAAANVTFTKPASSAASYQSGIGSGSFTDSANTSCSFTLDTVPVGTTEVTITVVAENGISREYKLAITRNPTPVTGITLDPNSITLSSQGATRTISAIIEPSGATNQVLTWTSSNTSAATVSSSGVVTAVAAGTSIITARATDGSNVSRTATVTVQSWDNGITALKVNNADALGTSPDFTANIGTGNTANVTFTKPASSTASYQSGSSSDNFNNPANTSCSFTLNNIPVGTTEVKITIVAENGTNREYKLAITRQATLVTGIILNPETMTLARQGASSAFVVTIQPSGVTNDVLTWTSNNTSVATVNTNGMVTAVGAGTTTITASATDGSNVSRTATVRVQSWNTGLTELRVNDTGVSGTSPNFSFAVANNVATANVSFTKHESATADYALAGFAGTTPISGSAFTVNLATGVNELAITVTAENGDKQTYNLRITRQSLGTITLEWDDTGNALIVPQGALTLHRQSGDKVTLTGPTGGTLYRWIIDGNYQNPGGTGQSYIFDSTGRALGTYNVSLWITDSTGKTVGGDAVKITVVE